MSEVNHWRKHFNIFLVDFFYYFMAQRAQMMILWTDMDENGEKEGKNVEKGFAFIAPFNSHKNALASCFYHFEG